MRPVLAADRLYALSLRPQEWDARRAHAELALRWGPLADDPTQPERRHWFLLMVEARVRLPPDDPLAATNPDGIEVLRCGWEAELELPVALPAAAIESAEALLAELLARLAATVNELAARAGCPDLLDAEIQARLLHAHGRHPPI